MGFDLDKFLVSLMVYESVQGVPDDDDDGDNVPEGDDPEGNDPTDDTDPDEGDDGDDTDPEGDEGDDDDDAEPSGKTGKPKDDGGKPKLFTQEDVNRIVEQRLSRLKKQYDQKLQEMEESIYREADVPELGRDKLAKAARLWAFLEANPHISKKVDEVLVQNASNAQQPRYTGPSRNNSRSEDEPDRIELLEAKIELRQADKVFRRYEREILAYAEAEGIEIRSARDLRIAYKAWKGEKLPLLTAHAEQTGKKKAQQQSKKVKTAAGVNRKGGAKTGKRDYTKMSIEEILAEEGLSLYEDD